MLRMLNGLEVVCGNFYNDSRLMETLLQDVTTTLPISKDYRMIAIPSGHFHYSPAIIGAIIARNNWCNYCSQFSFFMLSCHQHTFGRS